MTRLTINNLVLQFLLLVPFRQHYVCNLAMMCALIVLLNLRWYRKTSLSLFATNPSFHIYRLRKFVWCSFVRAIICFITTRFVSKLMLHDWKAFVQGTSNIHVHLTTVFKIWTYLCSVQVALIDALQSCCFFWKMNYVVTVKIVLWYCTLHKQMI